MMTIEYTKEIADKICSRLAGGESLKVITDSKDMPSRATVYRWFELYPDFETQSERARDKCAHLYADRVMEVVENTLDGSITPEAARVAISGLQWTASKLKPQKYGDKPASAVTINANSIDNRRVDVTFESLKLAPKALLEDLKKQIMQANEQSKPEVISHDE